MGLNQIHILVVDDEIDIREIIQEQFENFGFNVDTAGSGIEAWGMFQKHNYDVVITDVRMLDGTGPELLANIKGENVHHPKVFFISGYNDYSQEEIYHIGADGIFPKPFNATTLRESIKKATLPKQQKWAQKKLHKISQTIKIEQNSGESNIKLGRGGFFVQNDSPAFSMNEEIEFEIHLVNHSEIIKGDGIVLWTRNTFNHKDNLQNGFGLEIISLDKSCLENYKNFIDHSSILPYIPKG